MASAAEVEEDRTGEARLDLQPAFTAARKSYRENSRYIRLGLVEMLSPASTLFDALMTGLSAAKLQPFIEKLTKNDRQTLLCMVCFISSDAKTSSERAAELKQVLANNCDFFTASVACYEACKAKVPFSPLTSIG